MEEKNRFWLVVGFLVSMVPSTIDVLRGNAWNMAPQSSSFLSLIGLGISFIGMSCEWAEHPKLLVRAILITLVIIALLWRLGRPHHEAVAVFLLLGMVVWWLENRFSGFGRNI